MAEQPIAISEIADPDVIRVKLLASGRDVHAPLNAVGVALKAYFDTLYQPLAAALTSWAAVVRAAGFDTFAATPSSANLRSLLTDETGTGAAVFATSPTLVTPALGTPSALVLTNATGLPNASVIGLGTAALVNTGTTTGTIPLNDVGTFTPAFAATGATFSYSNQTGIYTKIGRLVEFDITLILNTSGNTLTANALTVTGLPFTSAGGAGVFPVRWSASTTSYIDMLVRVSGTTLVIEGNTAAATSNATPLLANGVLHATNGSTFRAIGVYHV